MYWTDLDSHTPRVERAHMDGSDRMVLPGVNGAEIKQPSNVAVDPLTGQVYWSDVNTEKIIRYAGEQEHSLGITGNAKTQLVFNITCIKLCISSCTV